MYQIMPDLNSEEYQELKADIAERGVMVPIEMDESGHVLDGHHRIKICGELGITDYPRVIRAGMSEEEKRLHARRLNMARRHLSQDQRRAMIREQLAETPEKSDRQIAAGLGVDHKTVSAQRTELESIGEIPQCSRETSDGRVYPARRKPISVFNPTAREERAMRNPDVLKKLAEGTAKSVVDAFRLALKETAVSKYKAAGCHTPQTVDIFTTANRYRVFYGDPPWAYRDERNGESVTGATDHYPTLPVSEICNLPIQRIAEENAVLFLWVPSPLLEDSFRVINAWGFRYKASFVWDKMKHNMGHYNSVRHEFLLVCTRGACTPDAPTLYDSVRQIERGAHSRKPDEFRALIDALYPYGERIELFARGRSAGWDVWGYEAGDGTIS